MSFKEERKEMMSSKKLIDRKWIDGKQTKNKEKESKR